jgi:hypothetical protein
MAMQDKHYTLVVPPVLLIEILADLKKQPREGRLEADVVWLAGKLLKTDSSYNPSLTRSFKGRDEPPQTLGLSVGLLLGTAV